MINKLPIIGWFFSIVASISLSIPFYFIWNALAPYYFYFIPERYQQIPFWHCVGLFIIIPIVRDLVTPKLLNVSNNSSFKKED